MLISRAEFVSFLLDDIFVTETFLQTSKKCVSCKITVVGCFWSSHKPPVQILMKVKHDIFARLKRVSDLLYMKVSMLKIHLIKMLRIFFYSKSSTQSVRKVFPTTAITHQMLFAMRRNCVFKGCVGERLYTGLIPSITTYSKTTCAVVKQGKCLSTQYINAVYGLAGISQRAGWSTWPLLKLPFLSPAAWLK